MNNKEIVQIVGELLAQQRFNEAINYLQNILENDPENKQVSGLLELIRNILKYSNRDIFASTNLDMDPWLE